MTPIPRLRSYQGPALLSYGFRPFFLFGSIYAGAMVLVWLPFFYGEISVSTAFMPRDWHVHEMIYGYVAAVITGFLLTAIPNWTGRLPIQGTPLLGLFTLWLAGRAAVTTSAFIGWLPAAIIDVSFLVTLAAASLREIVAGRNWANLKVLAVLAVLIAGNVVFHLEAHFRGAAEYGIRLGISAIIMLLMVIAGRIVPSFTRNFLARKNPGRLPVPYGRLDMVTLAASGIALVLWIVMPVSGVCGAALIVAGLLHPIRLARWAGDRTFGDRLVLVLHVAYAFVPVGFLLGGLGALRLIPASAGIHAWTAGAVGTMTLAVMTRASLGHTGRALAASFTTQVIYAAVVVAALSRVWAAVEPDLGGLLLHVAAYGWAAAFLGFAAVFAPILLGPRQARAG